MPAMLRERRRHFPLVAGVFFSILAFHLLIAWQDFGVLAKNGFLCDDSFYAFKIAQNIASGLGSSFDGIHSTNGFQPLYVFLLVPVYMVFPSSLTIPVKIALSFSAVFTVISAVFMLLIARRYVRESIALAIAAAWSMSALVIKQGANGLETSLALFLFVWSVYFYIKNIRGADNPSLRNFIMLGVLLGLTMLARVDEIILILAIVLDYLCLLRRRSAPPRALTGVFALVSAVIVVFLPWLIFNYIQMGTIMMDSGRATRFLSLAYAPFFNIIPAADPGPSPGYSFYEYQVFHSISVLKLVPPLQALYRILDRIGGSLGGLRIWQFAGTIGLMGFLGFVTSCFVKSRRNPGYNKLKELNFLLVFSVLLICAYSFYVFGFFFFIRYYYPIYFVLCIYVGILIDKIFGGVMAARSSWIRRTAFVFTGIYVFLFAYMSYSQAFRSKPVYCFYDVAKWAEIHTNKAETIGAFQCGAIGYLSGRRVVNLDGKVNRRAMEAIQKGNLMKYVEAEGVDVIMDRRNVIKLFLGDLIEKNRVENLGSGEAGIQQWMSFRLGKAVGSISKDPPGLNR